MSERVEAFDKLAFSFEAGTKEEVIWKYITPISQCRMAGGFNYETGEAIQDDPHSAFSVKVETPDGSDFWFTLDGCGRL